MNLRQLNFKGGTAGLSLLSRQVIPWHCASGAGIVTFKLLFNHRAEWKLHLRSHLYFLRDTDSLKS